MYYIVKITDRYTAHKNSFLSANGYKSSLETACKRIERSLHQLPIKDKEDPLLNLFAFYIKQQETGLEPITFAKIYCLCCINRQIDEIAPCGVYFEADFIKIPPNDRARADLVGAVLAELSW